ncbi:MAG: DUF721 domain-containing protein [Acidimicrobiales bacterium]|nr:DUF721 domain-containing protein [Acidimicrobiales bacterium]
MNGRRGKPGWTPLPTYSSAPTPLLSALDNLASTMGLTNVDSINALFVDWPEIVGEQLAQHCAPRSLRDQILTIEASDQQWATELKWMTSLLMERCCAALGPGAVTDVRIVR